MNVQEIIDRAIENHFSRVEDNETSSPTNTTTSTIEVTVEPQNASIASPEEEVADTIIVPTEKSHLLPTEILTIDDVARDKGAAWKQSMNRYSFAILGLGGIGSWTSLLVARLSPAKLAVYDPDKVEYTNLGGQLYRNIDLYHTKASSVAKIVREFSDKVACSFYIPVTASTPILQDFIICGFDNMAARKAAFSLWEKNRRDGRDQILIDARLSAEVFQIFVLHKDDEEGISNYKKDYLFEDSEAVTDVCSYKQTSYCASMIASFIVNIVINIIANKEGNYRSIPSLLTYDAYTMTLDYGTIGIS